MKRKPKDQSKPFSKFYKNKPKKQQATWEEEVPSRPKTKSTKPTSKNKKAAFNKQKKESSKEKKAPVVQEEITDDLPMRLNKYIAHAGICSRRKASEHIKNGLVTVNGTVVLEMGHKVQAGDEVRFEGEVVQPVKTLVYLLMNKPKNVITTLQDEHNRRTVMDFIKDYTSERVYPVGRLDRNTTGLLLLTNDGLFAQKLSHPSFGVKKVYKATLDKPLTEAHLEAISKTLQLEDGPAPVDAVAYGEKPNIIGIELHIGRNRIVRRIFEHLGYQVVKLDRVRYASLTKKNLPVGKCRFLTKQELIILKHLS